MIDYMWNQPHNRDEFVDQFIAGKVLTSYLVFVVESLLNSRVRTDLGGRGENIYEACRP